MSRKALSAAVGTRVVRKRDGRAGTVVRKYLLTSPFSRPGQFGTVSVTVRYDAAQEFDFNGDLGAFRSSFRGAPGAEAVMTNEAQTTATPVDPAQHEEAFELASELAELDPVQDDHDNGSRCWFCEAPFRFLGKPQMAHRADCLWVRAVAHVARRRG